jgi:tetratricopeptide (TPR) repeat protein
MQRGYLTEGLRWLRAVLARAGAESALSRRARAWVLVWAGLLLVNQGDLRLARELLEESLALFPAIDDQAGVIGALRELGLCLIMEGELSDQIRAVLDESLHLARAADDRRSIGLALDRLGLLASARHDYRQARKCLMEALGYYRQLGDVWAEAGSLMLRGFIALAQGDLDRARKDLDAGLALARRVQDQYREGQVLVLTARLARLEGDDRRVAALLKGTLRLLVEIGSFDLRYDALSFLAELAVRQGSHARGVRLFAAAARWKPASNAFWLVMNATVQANWDTALTTAKSTLGQDGFARAWAEGQAMTLDQAVVDALEEDDA